MAEIEEKVRESYGLSASPETIIEAIPAPASAAAPAATPAANKGTEGITDEEIIAV